MSETPPSVVEGCPVSGVLHIPILRAGVEYESLEQVEVKSHRDGRVMARVSQANAGMVRRDLRSCEERTAPLRAMPMAQLLSICKAAGELFLRGSLPLSDDGPALSADEFVALLSHTSGLPHSLCRRNMQKVFSVFDEMPTILRGLTRGMDPGVIDAAEGEHLGIPLCYGSTTPVLGVVLPSNSPGVNSIWIPALALKTAVVLKPGRDEPWTPARIARAFFAAGLPRCAFSVYPTDHEGSAAILDRCGRSLLFGDESVTKIYAGDPRVQIHGPGRSKVLIGDDAIEDWPALLDVLVASVADNGGRSCINASSIFVPRHGDAVAAALAERLAGIEPRPADDPEARLSAFAKPAVCAAIDGAIERGLAAGGAEDVTQRVRGTPRACAIGDSHFLRPTVVRCAGLDHPLARTEYLFPFCSVVEVPADRMAERIGPSLVVTAITRDRALIDQLVRSPHVDRLNLGPVPTSVVEWDQPHEGNLFELLYERRAFQRAEGW